MTSVPDRITPDHWLQQVFSSNEARRGGVIKRQVQDVERIIGRARFLEEAAARGCQVVENGRHFVLFCNPHPVRRVAAAHGLAQARGEAAGRRLLTRLINRV